MRMLILEARVPVAHEVRSSYIALPNHLAGRLSYQMRTKAGPVPWA